jgi:uncharacterized membrane protein
MRGLYNRLGFQKGYNFTLWFIFGGAMIGFVLARFQYLSFNVLCGSDGADGDAAPGECYWYTKEERYKVGIIMHLAGVLPAGFLAVFQFVPAIRHKAILYHRMAGYVAFVLILIGNVGALMIADQSFGGTFSTQAFVGFLAIITTLALVNAIYNIKRLQVDQHRAWMLRVWMYLGVIITARLIMFIAAQIISIFPGRLYYFAQNCGKLAFMAGQDEIAAKYPACVVNGNFSADAYAAVRANFNGDGVEEIASVLNVGFGMALWLALAMHAIGVEVYLHLTPKESERLREVSYQKQMEKGMKNPGSAGLVPEKVGDMDPWMPAEQKANAVKLRSESIDLSN